jgi:hypothetical protein
LLPFGATVMVRKGRAKRALDGQLAGKTDRARRHPRHAPTPKWICRPHRKW